MTTIRDWSKLCDFHRAERWFRLLVSRREDFLRVVNHWRSKRLVAAIEAPVGRVGPAADQQHHGQSVGGGGELGLPPALLQDLVNAEAAGGLVHVDLVLFEVADVVGGQVLQVEVDPLAGVHLDGPVAPQRRVGAQVVRREELTAVAAQQLVAAAQGKEGVVVTSV